MKINIVVDSSCGLTEKEAKQRGWFYLPLFMNIDGKEYADGIDITSNNFFEICRKESTVSTSCSSLEQIIDLFNNIFKNDPDSFILVYPISKHLSSQYANLLAGAKGFNNIHIINSKNVSTSIIQELVEFEISYNKNEITLSEGIDIIENKINRNLDNVILFPKYNDSLLRGGRLSPSAAKIAKLLKIIPVISFKNGKLEKLDKGRVFHKTVVNQTISNYKKMNNNSNNFFIIFGYSNKLDESILNEIKSSLNLINPPILLAIPSIIAIHTGLDAISISFVELKYNFEDYKFNNINGDK